MWMIQKQNDRFVVESNRAHWTSDQCKTGWSPQEAEGKSFAGSPEETIWTFMFE